MDGNKRTAVIAALAFLEGNGVDTGTVDTYTLSADLNGVANRKMNKEGLIERFRLLFAGADPDTN